jgi:hypothetical protein
MGHETDQLLYPSVGVKNSWSYTSILPLAFMVGILIKHWEIFTFNMSIEGKDTGMP